MVTNDIILLPSILLTKKDYILCQEIIYTYDKDNQDLSDTGRKKIDSKSMSIEFVLQFKVDKCVKRLTFLLN
jgi:hypothetical protein